MAIVIGDIIQFVDQQVYLSQQVLNVYHYEVVTKDPDVTYEDLAQQFELSLINPVTLLQSPSLIHTTLLVSNLTNGIDIWEEITGQAGQGDSGDTAPSFTSYSFRLIRSTALTRHGSKRIGGVPEAYTSGNGLQSLAYERVNTVAAAMGAYIVREGTVSDFELRPVIVGRYPQDGPNAGEMDLSKINPVASAQYIRLTTQTTRRAGRGS
jgi:hypothetical protein